MSDRIAVIDSGQLQQIDPPLTCYNEPSNLFVAGFIGSPAMNFVDGEIAEGGFRNERIEVDFDPASVGAAVGDDVTLGVRPEDVYLVSDSEGLTTPTKEIDAVTDVLEPMGDEIFVYLLLNEDTTVNLDEDARGAMSNQLLMSVDPDSDIAEDESVSVVLDRSRVHLFDTETGEAIQHGLSTTPTAGPDSGASAESDD